MGFVTEEGSWKVRRIRNARAVELAPSDGRGHVAARVVGVSGNAEVIDDTQPEFTRLEASLADKYGLQYRLFRLIQKIRGKRVCGIAITVGD
jgi:PPOX class probable F420-dependent enzyme